MKLGAKLLPLAAILFALATLARAQVVVGNYSNSSQEVDITKNPLQSVSITTPWLSKLVMLTGDSTTALGQNALIAWCYRTGPGQDLAGLPCMHPTTYSIDGSHNVTVVMLDDIPASCAVGKYVWVDGTASFQTNALNNATGSNSTFVISGIDTAAKSITFNNSISAGVTGSSATGNSAASCNVINNGSNGATQSVYNGGAGQGGAGLVSTLKPDLNIHSMGINDVRGGAVSVAQLTTLVKSYIETLRGNSPKTSILLVTPNSFLQDDPGSNGWVTSPTTTSTTAVGATGSAMITLASMLNSISGLVTSDLTLAQEVANGSAHLVVDSGGSQETVPITAIDVVGKTVTATFAQTHSAGFTVVPNLPTMAQAYTNILHDTFIGFEGVYSDVQVADTQAAIFGRLVQTAANNPFLANQIHPSLTGYTERAIYEGSVLSRDQHFGIGHSSIYPYAGATIHASSVQAYNPFLSFAAILNNFTACWTNGYLPCVENPDYYTLVGGGGLVTYGSASYIRIGGEPVSVVTGESAGVIPIAIGDVIEIVGYGNAVATSAAGAFSTYLQVSTASTLPANIPISTPVRVYRPKYRSAAQILYAKSPSVYTYHHAVNLSGGTNFIRFTYTDVPGSLTWGGMYSTADTLVESDGTVQAMTGCVFTRVSDTVVQCAVTGAFGSIPAKGDIYGTHQMEGTFSLAATPTSYTAGTNVTSCACAAGAICTTAAGKLTIVGGTATTGTICSPVFPATPYVQKCTADQNGGAAFYGIGNSVATATGFDITAGVSVSGATVTVNYFCQP